MIDFVYFNQNKQRRVNGRARIKMFTGIADTDWVICSNLDLHDLQSFLLVNRYLYTLIMEKMKKNIDKVNNLMIDTKIDKTTLSFNTKPCTFYNYLGHVKSACLFIEYDCLKLDNLALFLDIIYNPILSYLLTIYSHDCDGMMMYNLTSKQLKSFLYHIYYTI